VKYDYSVHYIAGKLLYTADGLSRPPVKKGDNCTFQEEVDVFVDSMATYFLPPQSTAKQSIYQQAQEADPVCQQLQ